MTRLAKRMGGMSMVELMVGMTLGMFLIAGIGSVFVATGEANRSNENLSRVQEAARTAFSLLARDIREAGLNDCGRISRVVNVLNNAAATPWANWNQGVVGAEAGVAMPGLVTGAGFGQRVGTEDAIQIMKGASRGVTVVSHNTASATIRLTDDSSFRDGDVLIICDFTQASIFQVTNVNAAGGDEHVVHNTGGARSPGNCSKGLGWADPPVCTVTGKEYPYPTNSTVLAFESMYWYIGNNGRPGTGGTSLFRMRLQNTGGSVAMVPEEVLEGVSGLQLQYLVSGAANYVDAAAGLDWSQVLAVRIGLTMSGLAEEASARGESERVGRNYFNVVTLRNRVS